MNLKNFFQKNWIHFVAIGLFLIIAAAYFSPQLDDYALKQDDIEKYIGMANEINHHRELTGEEPLWTNSMFGGMPATLIKVEHQGNYLNDIKRVFYKMFPAPAGTFILHLLCFYIMAILFRVRPVIAMIGAFAYAFASYELIIMAAGHFSKAMAVSFLPLVLGGFVYAFKRDWIWGSILSVVFLSLELSSNHLQVTYYLVFLLLALGIYFLIDAIRKKELKRFFITSGAMVGAYILAILINIGNISMSQAYSKYTIRGDQDLTINADGTERVNGNDGLSIDYITQWSYGKGESMTMLSPYVRGSNSGSIANSDFIEMAEDMDGLDTRELELAKEVSMYWGNQPGVAGPVYLGIVVVFLAFLGMFFIKDSIKWFYLGIALLCLLFSWGSNAMGATEFFVNNLPLYNKFRTVTIALVILQLIVPVLGVLLLQKLYENREQIKEKKKLFLIGSGVFLVILLGMRISTPDSFSPKASIKEAQMNNYIGSQLRRWQAYERQQPGFIQNQIGVNPQDQQAVVGAAEAQAEEAFGAMRKIRKEMYIRSTNRSLLLGICAIGLVALFFFTNINAIVISSALGILVLIDMVPVARNYLGEGEDFQGNSRNWITKDEKAYPYIARAADERIMSDELASNSELKSVVDKGAEIGEKKAEELDYTGAAKRRIIDSYRFRALSAATHYRVFDVTDGWSGTYSSYYHKALSGYHAAKLRRIQNAFEFHIVNSNNEFFNMMNVKYFIQGEGADNVKQNPNALGVGWAVKEVKVAKNPNDEIRSLGKTFTVKNEGSGQLLLNGKAVQSAKVYGTEQLGYLPKQGDTISFRIENYLQKGQSSIFALNGNGGTGFVSPMELQSDSLNQNMPLVEVTCTEVFKAADEAIVSKEVASKLSKKKYSGEATVKLDKYAPNKMSYDINCEGEQLVVFSEIYYPDGWSAKVDGKEVDILRVNYLLRGLELKGGKHKVEFEYRPASYYRSGTISSIATIVLFLLIAFGIFYTYFRGKKEVAQS